MPISDDEYSEQRKMHDAKVQKHDAAIQEYDRSIGIKNPAPVTPRQRRAFKAGIERAAQVCDAIAVEGTFSGRSMSEHCAAAIRALLK